MQQAKNNSTFTRKSGIGSIAASMLSDSIWAGTCNHRHQSVPAFFAASPAAAAVFPALAMPERGSDTTTSTMLSYDFGVLGPVEMDDDDDGG